MRLESVVFLGLLLVSLSLSPSCASSFALNNATVRLLDSSCGRCQAAVNLLVGDVIQRIKAACDVSMIPCTPALISEGVSGHWERFSQECSPDRPCVGLQVLSDRSGAGPCYSQFGLSLGLSAESFVICVDLNRSRVDIAARSTAGLVLAAGRFLREVRIERASPRHIKAAVPVRMRLSVDPPAWASMRGQQITDWGFYMTDANFEEFVKQQIVFGTNQIEFAHITYDGLDPNGIPRNDAKTMLSFATIIDRYSLKVSIWNPPWPSNATEAVFAAMPRVDSLFFEGGALDDLRDAVTVLRKTHPNATSWHSPGGLNLTQRQDWYKQLAMPDTMQWLDGVVWGPIDLGGEVAMLQQIPAHYKVRLYPDICHTLTAMYPVPAWHHAWAFTSGRQVVNPMPSHMGHIIATNQNVTFQESNCIGFGGYSEGAADDVNKALWAALYLEPDSKPLDVAQQYVRYYFGLDETNGDADLAVQLLFGLEQNWVGDAATNDQVLATLSLAQQLASVPSALSSWRLQGLLFRAHYDAYVQARLRFEQSREERAYEAIQAAAAAQGDVSAAMSILQESFRDEVASEWKQQAVRFASLINSSKTLCDGCVANGALVLQSQIPSLSLDTIDNPLADQAYLQAALANVSMQPAVPQRVHMLNSLLRYTDPGPDGFYDRLGTSPQNPRLSLGFGPAADPQYVFAPLVQFDEDTSQWAPCGSCGAGNGSVWRIWWHYYAQTYGDQPLSLHYDGVNPNAHYMVRIVYAYQGWSSYPLSSLWAIGTDASVMLHDFQPAPKPNRPLEFVVPMNITAGGRVTLECRQPPGSAQNGNGRGCQIAEVWLVVVDNERK